MTANTQFLLGVSGQVMLARALGVLAEFGIADRLAPGPRSAAALAADCGADPDSLYRLLRFAASHEVFAENDNGEFVLTPRADLLRSDRPDSLRAFFASAWQDLAWDTYRAMPAAARTGAVAFDLAHGQPFFDYLASHPEAGAAFDHAMSLAAAARKSGDRRSAGIAWR